MRWCSLLLLAACDGSTSPAVDAPAADARSDASSDAASDVYQAFAVAGGLDRVVILKARGGACYAIVLRSPGTNTTPLVVPSGWELESAHARQPAAACNPGYAGPVANTVDATSVTGMVAWQQTAALPSSISALDVTLSFPSPPMWFPASERLVANDVPVQ